MVTALQSFALLKEFKLSIDEPRNGDARVDNAIHALIEHHTGLRKLTIAGFQLVGRGCAALCAALATSSLSKLHLQFNALNFDGLGAFFGHIDDTGHLQMALQEIPRSRYLKSIVQDIYVKLRGSLSSLHFQCAR